MNPYTYEVIQLVEITNFHRVRGANARAAYAEATKRTARACATLVRARSTFAFGNAQDDFVPAKTETHSVSEN
ncbi:hypothetical protein J2W35_006990 [Variovorax boronicumulans]|uniref:hypothetical protein n=1 Tax=Variovorax boronicumulans TaxID=436515 RepID=UPI002786C3B8|nr:hypothetical protein [Variovorax boronicumulans]MDQ0086603.1 hypothetical protein [Variovorax boronicumulans]